MLGTNRKKFTKKNTYKSLVQLHAREGRDMTGGLHSGRMQEHLKTSSHFKAWSKARRAGGYLGSTCVIFGNVALVKYCWKILSVLFYIKIRGNCRMVLPVQWLSGTVHTRVCGSYSPLGWGKKVDLKWSWRRFRHRGMAESAEPPWCCAGSLSTPFMLCCCCTTEGEWGRKRPLLRDMQWWWSAFPLTKPWACAAGPEASQQGDWRSTKPWEHPGSAWEPVWLLLVGLVPPWVWAGKGWGKGSARYLNRSWGTKSSLRVLNLTWPEAACSAQCLHLCVTPGCPHFCACLSACRAALCSLTSHPMTWWDSEGLWPLPQTVKGNQTMSFNQTHIFLGTERHFFCLVLAVSGGHPVSQFLLKWISRRWRIAFSIFSRTLGAISLVFFFHLHMIITLGPHSYCRFNDTKIGNVVSMVVRQEILKNRPTHLKLYLWL